MDFIVLLLKLVYFMLPAYFANMAPVFGKRLLSKKALLPIDLGGKLGGHPLFGKHKTFGGFVFGILIALVVAYLQHHSYPYLKEFCFVDYQNLWINIGFLMGAGALTGDLVESFIKRRFNVRAGKPWFPYDELDFAIGALIFVSPVYFPGWLNILLILMISLTGHVLLNWLGYYLGVVKKKDIIDPRYYFEKIFKKIVKQ